MDQLSYLITPTQGQMPDDITFTIIQSLGWEREPILDESHTTYLYTRVRGSVILSYAPAAAAFKPNVNLFGVPEEVEDFPNTVQFPAPTDVAIRRFLEQPRGQITVASNGVVWLQSPPIFQGAPLKCDARNGPFTKVHSVMQIQGERLWKIHFEFETYINEYPTAYGVLPPAIISNRWYAIDDINWQHLRTRIYQGICTVRADNINNLAVVNTRYIDALRNSFAGFTVPVGFQREKVHVTVTPDGLSAHYMVVDTEQIFNKVNNCPAVRIEIADTNWMRIPPAAKFTGAVLRELPGAFLAGAAGAAGQIFMQQNPGIGEFATQLEKAAVGALSKVYRNVLVRAWGNRITSRIRLVNFALGACLSRLGAAALVDTTTSEILITQDTNNFVQVNVTISWGADFIQGLVGNFLGGALVIADNLFQVGAIGPGTAAFRTALAANPDTGPAGVDNASVVAGLGTNPIFPGDNQTRGTAFFNPSLQTLVTQTLEGFDILPAAPSALPV